MSSRITHVLIRVGRALCLTIAAAFLIGGTAAAGNGGDITSLSASDAPSPGDSITVMASIEVDGAMKPSNIFYRIYAPDGKTIVATHTTNLGTMGEDGAFNDAWTVSNDAFPTSGSYVMTACWSAGSATDCGIDAAKTAFFSVPTMGWAWSGVALGLLGVFIWRRRDLFDRFHQPE